MTVIFETSTYDAWTVFRLVANYTYFFFNGAPILLFYYVKANMFLPLFIPSYGQDCRMLNLEGFVPFFGSIVHFAVPSSSTFLHLSCHSPLAKHFMDWPPCWWKQQEKQSFINGPRFNDERLQLFSIPRLRFIAFLACSSLVSCFILACLPRLNLEG